MAKSSDPKSDIFSMAAERIGPVKDDSQLVTSLEAVKLSADVEDVSLPTTNLSKDDSKSSEDFFDAEDSPVASHMLDTHMATGSSLSPGASVSSMDGDLSDIEEVCDVDDITNMEGLVSQNKSIILHILSQVRVGMDLTRFPLPAFLVESRSVLQMYASLFGRPNMILEVSDQPTPRERMIAVVKWFLASISASRKESAPKKPYNPVLGETFHCYWDVPNGKRTPPDHQKIITDTGPFPQAGYDSFTYIAEQVSHHPPVSAFYCECPGKNMYVSATIGTKVKLTPSLAAKAVNTGSFRISLLEHDEEYVSTLPHGYVRGVLTIPWFEFGGECILNCAKTGHTAKIDFHTKPFTGGKRNKVTAELRHKSDKKPYMFFEGEWDSALYTKEPGGKPELFLDARTPTFPRKWRKLSAVEPTDSRVIWQRVTEAILIKDEQAAADAKYEVEEKQRANVKERARTGEVFEHQYFHQSKDDPSVWEYNSPLNERLAALR